MLRTHRLAWMLEHGKIPSGLCVCHHCDNPSCVNPSHLFVGTHADNAHDRDSKGRRQPPRGAKHGRARLTRENIQEIRALYATGEYLQRELGEQFGVSRGYVSQIVGREAWAWLE